MIEVLIPTRPQMAIKMLEESPSQGGFLLNLMVLLSQALIMPD